MIPGDDLLQTEIDDDRDREPRLYFVVRSDFVLARAALIRGVAQATGGVFARARETAPERVAAYAESAQGKIVLRVKSQTQLKRALSAAQVASISSQLVYAAPGFPAAVGFGPVSRIELPEYIRGLQLLSDAPTGPAAPLTDEPGPPNGARLWVLVRADLEIPYGKLAAQAGHASWGALEEAVRTEPERFERWGSGGSPVAPRSVRDLAELERAYELADRAGLPAAFIVDAGRTVFDGPTPTVVGIGPVDAQEYPEGLSLAPLEPLGGS